MPIDTPPETSFYTPVLKPAPHSRLLPETVAWKEGLMVRSSNWLGDVLMGLPAVYKMRRLLPPGLHLSVICPQSLKPVWEATGWVDHVIGLADKRLHGAAARKARELNAGVGIVMPNSFGSALDLFRAGVKVRIGRGGRGRSILLKHRLPGWHRAPGLADQHQVNHYLELASAMGNICWDVEYPCLCVQGAADIARAFGLSNTNDSGSKWLALAPGAAYGPAKQWPEEYFRQVAEWWHARGGRIMVIGTGADQEVAGTILEGLEHAIDLTGKTSLREVMAVLQTVDAVVANDSGAMHLAAALGTPGVAIFGSTDPIATGPLGKAAWITLREPVDCSPCFQRTCPLPENRYKCLKSIAPGRVIAACEHLLNKD